MTVEKYYEMEKESNEYLRIIRTVMKRTSVVKESAMVIFSDGLISRNDYENISDHYSRQIKKYKGYIDVIDKYQEYLRFECGLETEEPDAFGSVWSKPVLTRDQEKLLEEAVNFSKNLRMSELLDGGF